MIFDAHCDTITLALDKKLSLNDKKLDFNIQETKLPHIQALATFINPKYKNGFKRANNILDKFYEEYNKNTDKMYLIKEKSDIKESLEKLGIILTIENGSAIDDNIENVDKLYNRGIRVMSITWNSDNKLGCGALTTNDTGLTNFGKEYIKKLNELNIIVDVSHASSNTFYDTLKCTEKPIIATHSCVKKICNHPRNLTDEQIKEIANIGGVIGICFNATFLSNSGKANSDDIIYHIEHIINLVGEEHVGFGSDFDGMKKKSYLSDIKGVKDLDIIIEKLKKIGLNDTQINKITGENFLRVLRKYM